MSWKGVVTYSLEWILKNATVSIDNPDIANFPHVVWGFCASFLHLWLHALMMGHRTFKQGQAT